MRGLLNPGAHTLTVEVSDYDGDQLLYSWKTADDFEFVSDFVDTIVGGQDINLPEYIISGGLPVGEHSLFLYLNDGYTSEVVEGTTIVVALDTQAPIVDPVVDPRILMKTKEFEPVQILLNAEDDSGIDAISVEVKIKKGNRPFAIARENEDYQNVTVDTENGGMVNLDLMARGNSTVYKMVLRVADALGNTTKGSVKVRVRRK